MKAPFAVAEQARRAIAAHPELVQDGASQECAMVFALVAEGLKGDQAKEWTKRLGSVFIVSASPHSGYRDMKRVAVRNQ